MAKTIVQTVVFRNTTAKDLYDLYMNSKKHSAATGAPAKISLKEGGLFTAHGPYITGKNLKLIKDQLIVQSWRASDWDQTATDSTFTIMLEPKAKNVVLHVIHSNVPDESADSIDKGWYEYYWEPWKKYLAGKPISQSVGIIRN